MRWDKEGYSEMLCITIASGFINGMFSILVFSISHKIMELEGGQPPSFRYRVLLFMQSSVYDRSFGFSDPRMYYVYPGLLRKYPRAYYVHPGFPSKNILSQKKDII